MRVPSTSILCLLSALLSGMWLATASAADKGASGQQPNIIFILADDLGYDDIGVFYQNHRQAKGEPCEFTPHLDAMAEQGIQLRDHYSAIPADVFCRPPP